MPKERRRGIAGTVLIHEIAGGTGGAGTIAGDGGGGGKML
ncbi:hypothetical protein BOS5A_200211 [Bosea sp. EC-HK365B]|nr:hypothetical protein BOSE21B_100210 [Bosea sp. 21B]CAD5301552.1 hypothetical protein BOSE46_90580 [Bosea sp. 46]VVT57667.1 hypothetical protein BOS5A_200211 [Bosea sp. EC-HK365B]VXB29190.1 hypothetical protein BOSE29B_100022 [Bosea sp. 29B]VXB72695.1 hypothetical protein BOSE125_150020 [Bosea sp. 125]VXC92835.1 hypothetical protein BOSE127_80103 [Bosea sp. 127]